MTACELLRPVLNRARVLGRALFSLLAVLMCAPLSAATLLAIVSERNAAEMAQAAQAFHAHHEHHRLVFRTSAQLDAMPDAEVSRAVSIRGLVLITTVFRETAQRILPVIRASGVRNVIALAGDPALGRNSRWGGQRLFADNDRALRRSVFADR